MDLYGIQNQKPYVLNFRSWQVEWQEWQTVTYFSFAALECNPAISIVWLILWQEHLPFCGVKYQLCIVISL
jgi:hypothetical protein